MERAIPGDTRTAQGLRERAIALLLARLGLRAGEILRLRLDDLDWGTGRVTIRAGKTRRERVLPLSQEVGDALIAYLRQGRPLSPCREVFLRWRPPFRALRSSSTLSTLARKWLTGAGIHRPHLGAHVFRHSLATGLVRRGVPFKAVADVLGHQALASTGLYAKLDLGSLTWVALPWPGGAR